MGRHRGGELVPPYLLVRPYGLGVVAALISLFNLLAELLDVAAELFDFRSRVAKVQPSALAPCGFQGEDRLAKRQQRLHLGQPAAIPRRVGQRAVQLIGQQQVIDPTRRAELPEVQAAEFRPPGGQQALEAIEALCGRRQFEGPGHARLVGLILADQLGHVLWRRGRGLVGRQSRPGTGQDEEECYGYEAFDQRERPHHGRSWRWVESCPSVQPNMPAGPGPDRPVGSDRTICPKDPWGV